MLTRVRVLPCPRCGHAKTHDGRPYWMQRYPEGPPVIRYVCAGCNPQRDPRTPSCIISAAEFYALPPLQIADLDALGLTEIFLRDYTLGGALKDSEARDLLLAGFEPADLVELQR